MRIETTHALESNDLGIVPKLQTKDTHMLCLQGCPSSGSHAWDSPHETTGEHGSWFCAITSIAIIISYYNGSLSQDRICHYVSGELYDDGSPENDLRHRRGISPDIMTQTLSWGLNGAKVYLEGYPNQNFTKPSLEQFKRWIDEGRPILRGWEYHVTVIDGYDGNHIHVIDPASAIETRIHYDDLEIFNRWIPPANATGRSDEPEIWMDSDSDGIVDFDEISRFFTDHRNPDSDFDGVPDKAEIISYTFLSDGSFDSEDVRQTDTDNDGWRAELDWDSDNGGVPDGMEDLNHNGFVDIGETDPLNATDDPLVEYPVAIFTHQPETAWVNETITFDATQCYSPNGNITWYAWNFEDLNLAATQEPFINHTYSSEGRYNVTLEVTDEKFWKASTSNIVNVTYRTDLNKDLEVNIMDIALVAKTYGTEPEDPDWNSIADLDDNGIIDIRDIAKVAKDYGKTV